MGVSVGFVGFGEAGSALAVGLSAAGARVAAWDAALADPARAPAMRARAQAGGVVLCPDAAGAARGREIVVSAVVSSVALEVAGALAPHLSRGQIYVDINSTSPAVKREVAGRVGAAGAEFVEAAVMAAVPPMGIRVPMLLCGEAAPELIERLGPLGMNLEDFGPDIGRASATKMFRSVLVKGLEALFVECVVGASRYGVAERVFETMNLGYPGLDWGALASHLLGRTVLHGERRAHELEEVAATLESLGIEPLMARAGATRLHECARLGLAAHLDGRSPPDHAAFARAVAAARAAGD